MSKIDQEITSWVNSLSVAQMSKLYEIIDGEIPADIDAMSDDELLSELEAAE